MRNFILAVFCVTIVFFQLSVSGSFFRDQRTPDLTLALVLAFTIAMGFEKSFLWSILVGLLIDIGNNTIFGTTALLFIFISWTVSYLANIADIRSKKMYLLSFLAIMTILVEAMKDLVMVQAAKIKIYYFQNSSYFYAFHYDFDYFAKIIYTVIAVFLIYYAFRRITRFLFLEPIKLASRI